MPTRLLLSALLLSTLSHAQDVHVRVSPDVKTGIEATTEFPTIQMAMDHHPFAGIGSDGKPGRIFIEIAPGTYRERVIVTQNHTNITLLGMGKSPTDVVITNSLNAKQAGGTFFTETVEINGSGFEADNITFERPLRRRCAPIAPSSSTAGFSATRTRSSPTTDANTMWTLTSRAEPTLSLAMPPRCSITLRFTPMPLAI